MSDVVVAKNNMRLMMKGDLAFFYHSNCKIPGIVGTMEIVQEHSVDGKQLTICSFLHIMFRVTETLSRISIRPGAPIL